MAVIAERHRPLASSKALLHIARERIAALRLDLSGLTVLTEAATGAYASTAVIAALAGAKAVYAVARDTARHGSARDAADATLGLARMAGVEGVITVCARLGAGTLAASDIVTNSGHLRPITRAMVEHLPAGAVIALMFEAWEFRAADLDLAACRDRGIRVAAVNERHPQVAVFPFLGPLCVRLLDDGGLTPAGRRILLLCDNPFAPYLRSGLEEAGAIVAVAPSVADLPAGGPWDAVVQALDPTRNPALDAEALALLACAGPRAALLAQFWGDIDRRAARRAGFSLTPPREPRPGHMGILLDALGPEPIVRLQAGGLAAAAAIHRGDPVTAGGLAEIL